MPLRPFVVDLEVARLARAARGLPESIEAGRAAVAAWPLTAPAISPLGW